MGFQHWLKSKRLKFWNYGAILMGIPAAAATGHVLSEKLALALIFWFGLQTMVIVGIESLSNGMSGGRTSGSAKSEGGVQEP